MAVAPAGGDRMRFNSPEHLDTWKRFKRYPAIHDNMAAAASSYLRGTRILDLGCSYGLLGSRIAKELGYDTAIGVEADTAVIHAAEQVGVNMVFHNIRISAETMSQLDAIIRAHGVNVILARRVMPELFGDDLQLGVRFAAMCASAGVKEMLVEGRVLSGRSTNALASIDAEVAMLAGCYREAKRVKAISYLQVI
jgi:SAM-dependent methyltransferase